MAAIADWTAAVALATCSAFAALFSPGAASPRFAGGIGMADNWTSIASSRSTTLPMGLRAFCLIISNNSSGRTAVALIQRSRNFRTKGMYLPKNPSAFWTERTESDITGLVRTSSIRCLQPSRSISGSILWKRTSRPSARFWPRRPNNDETAWVATMISKLTIDMTTTKPMSSANVQWTRIGID